MSALRAERHGVRRAVVADVVVGRDVAVLPRRDRPRIEEAPPALPRAIARFVVAAHDDPRRGGEQPARRLEEVGLPCVPAVAPRAAGASGLRGGHALFAIVIVADVDDEVGLPSRRPRWRRARTATRRGSSQPGRRCRWKRCGIRCRRGPRCAWASAFGSGSGWPSTSARVAPAGNVASHVITGNAEAFGGGRSLRDGRTGIVCAAHAHGHRRARRRRCRSPGIARAAVMTRATGTPSGPSTT